MLPHQHFAHAPPRRLCGGGGRHRGRRQHIVGIARAPRHRDRPGLRGGAGGRAPVTRVADQLREEDGQPQRQHLRLRHHPQQLPLDVRGGAVQELVPGTEAEVPEDGGAVDVVQQPPEVRPIPRRDQFAEYLLQPIRGFRGVSSSCGVFGGGVGGRRVRREVHSAGGDDLVHEVPVQIPVFAQEDAAELGLGGGGRGGEHAAQRMGEGGLNGVDGRADLRRESVQRHDGADHEDHPRGQNEAVLRW